MRVLTRCLVALVGLIPAAAVPTPSDGTLDWIGTWVLDRRLSSAPFLGLPDQRSDTITSDDTNIIIRTIDDSHGNTEVRVRRVALDGKEHEVSGLGSARKETAQWEKDVLIIRSRQAAIGRTVTTTERWKLGGDRSIVIDRHIVAEGVFQVDERLILKRVPAPNGR